MVGDRNRQTTPRLDKLSRFLAIIETHGPISLYRVAKLGGFIYQTAQRYLKYCVEKGLVKSLGRGERRSMRLVLTEKGKQFLEALRT